MSILKNQGTDNLLLFNTYVATGAFLQVLDRQQEAIPYFKLAFALKKNLPGIKDSVLFRPLVYCGNSYYRLDKLDSAQLLYKQAEQIAERNPTVSELERLYNTLGVIAYSTGDYTKSITYYAGAVTTLTKQKHPDKALLVTYMNNQAMAYRRLNKYQETLNIYKQLLPYGIETDKLLHNMGAVYLAIGESKTAISYLLKVNYEDQKKLNDVDVAFPHPHEESSSPSRFRMELVSNYDLW
ncbi:MAG: tetratricopeptide repeat protein [Hymenobacter sp.]|nr:MAG: tetratricopeptide repeat protein [Hymenobacter sp.]